MSKRKASADRNNGKQRAPSVRQSVTSLLSKNNRVQQQRLSRPGKSPSTENLRTFDRDVSSRTVLTSKVPEVCVPKTRFSSQDRCTDALSNSSSRLKSFPAEKVKKLDSPPVFTPTPLAALIVQQNPCETGTIYIANPGGACQNNGQGDASGDVQSSHQHRRQESQNVGSTSQQQVAPHQAVHQVGQPNPNSDSMLAQQTASPNSQLHRPFVPNVPHGMAVRDYSPRKTGSLTLPNRFHGIVQNPQTIPVQIPPTSSRTCLSPPLSNVHASTTGGKLENGDNRGTEKSSPVPDEEKQPVGGRNAIMHRKAVMRAEDKQHQENRLLQVPTENDSSNQPSSYTQPSVSHLNDVYSQYNGIPRQDPRQIYQQTQQNLAHQQQMQQYTMNHQHQLANEQRQIQANREGYRNYYKQQEASGNYFSGQGMTSPQDMTVSQIKAGSTAFPTHQRDIGYTMIPQNGWIQNNRVIGDHPSIRTQLKPFAVDLTSSGQQFSGGHQQRSMYPQILPQYQQQQALMTQYRPSVNSCQKNMVYQAQEIANTQSNVDQQLIREASANQQSMAQSQPQATNKVSSRQKGLQFTTEMIRDQELLVATMKQQGIPADIMKRQFETLLNEQRRHLIYMEEVHRQEEPPETKRPEVVVRRKNRMDEKPEWMVHITPPRVSYTEMETFRKTGVQERQGAVENQQSGVQQVTQQHKMNEMADREVQSQRAQMHSRQAHPDWNRQNYISNSCYGHGYSGAYDPIVRSVDNTANQFQACNQQTTPIMYQHTGHPANAGFCRYTQHPLQPQYNSHDQFHRYPEAYRIGESQEQANVTNDKGAENNVTRVYGESMQNSEPCSLLKMRVYKEVIRPQKRNNGLQDPETVQKALEAIKNPEERKGLEYLANLTKKKPMVKLNGTQDPSEIHPDLQQQPPSMTVTQMQAQRKLLANGLENTRNANNPPQRRLCTSKKINEEIIMEYPRQRQGNPRNCYSMRAERENNTMETPAPTYIQQPIGTQQQLQDAEKSPNVAACNNKHVTMTRGSLMPFKFDGTRPEHYQQMQQYYRNARNFASNNGEGDIGCAHRADVSDNVSFNRAGGDACVTLTPDSAERQQVQNKVRFEGLADESQRMNGSFGQPDIREPRTFGGITYLARKADYIPNSLTISPEVLISSRHLQPPIIC